MPQEFYLTGIKELFDRCNKYIAVRAIMLKNKTEILFLPFVRHIELQKFLIAPRISKMYYSAMFYEFKPLSCKHETTYSVNVACERREEEEEYLFCQNYTVVQKNKTPNSCP